MWLTYKDQSPVNLRHCKTIQTNLECQGDKKYYTIEFRDTGVRWKFESEQERDREYSRIMVRLTKPMYVIPPSDRWKMVEDENGEMAILDTWARVME